MTTIVQLSDTHITEPGRLAYGRVDTHAALRRAVAHINALPERIGAIDAVVVSGDLADLATAAEYAAFRDLTAPLTPPVFVMAGNHDARAPLRAAFADADYLPAGEGPLDYAVEIGALRVIALDSSVAGAPHGDLQPAQIDWLARMLAAAPEQPTLVFVHHPPFDTGIAFMDGIRLRDAAPLIETLSAHSQVLLLGCGHVHRTISTSLNGLNCRIAPSPAHAVSLDYRDAPTFELEPGGVMIHRWTAATNSGLGQLQSQVSFIEGYPGPFSFFGE